MQLTKKNPRDPQFAEEQFEEQAEAPAEQYPATETTISRSQRRTPELESGDAGARPAAVSRQESVIDAFSTFDGKYETQHDLRIQGAISGEVVCRGVFTVEAEATVRARIQTRDGHIHGRMEGDIVCSGKLVLAATANVSGTLKAATLVVEEGATLSGTVEASSLTSKIEAAAPSAPPPARAVASIDEERQERRQADAVASAAPAPARNGRQAPSFAFVPSDDRRPDRN